MKCPVQAAAVVRRAHPLGLPPTSRVRPDRVPAAVAPSTGCYPPTSWYWCYCPTSNDYVCCPIDATCSDLNYGKCLCQ